MNIDLLFTRGGEAGLITNQNLMQKALGVLLEVQSGLITIEFADMDVMELNIPVEQDYIQYLDFNQTIHLGSVIKGHIAQAYQVPLLFADDPYRNQSQKIEERENPLRAFEHFVKSCVAGQSVHREDLGDEDAMGCILGDASPASLEFAPHLARRHALEAKPSLDLGNVPSLGLGSSGSAVRTSAQRQTGKDDTGKNKE